MYSSNSFNVCPHCGKANSLSARYCSSCGKQLAMPEEVVVCHKCHRNNSPMASFCGSCGAPLRVGAQTKICPKCHKEVDVNSNVCSCGYSFSGVRYAEPNGTPTNGKRKTKTNPALTDPRNKGARGIAVFSLILLLLFAYLIIAPAIARPGFLKNFDKGIFMNNENGQLYGYDLVYLAVTTFMSGGFAAVTENFGIGGLLWAILVVILALTMIIQLIAIIAKLVSAKRHKKNNWYHLVMAGISTLCLALLWVFYLVAGDKTDGWSVVARNIFIPTVSGSEMFGMGYIIYLIPVYFWLCFFVSVGGKQKKVRETVA